MRSRMISSMRQRRQASIRIALNCRSRSSSQFEELRAIKSKKRAPTAIGYLSTLLFIF
jgi:hypothetical protein